MKIEDSLKAQLEYLEVVLKEDVQYQGHDAFEDIFLLQNTLTPVSIKDIDLTTHFMGKTIKYPFAVASLVGGHEKLTAINEKIAEFSKKFEIAMGIGDQIYGLKIKEGLESYKIVRKKNPDGLIIGNLAARNLLQSKTPSEDVQNAIDMIKADALEIYFDPLRQLLLELDKTTGFNGFDSCIKEILDKVKTPIIAKSYGTGLSNEDTRQLWDLGIAGLNIQGMGGTSFARIRTVGGFSLAEKQVDPPIKKPFDFWGTPTLWSLLDISLRSENSNIPLMVGGGIRSGIQAVKALALGADIITIGYPVLIELTEDFGYPNEKNLNTWFEKFIHEIKNTMALMGVKNVSELRALIRNRILIMGKTKEWLTSRNLQYPPTKIRIPK